MDGEYDWFSCPEAGGEPEKTQEDMAALFQRQNELLADLVCAISGLTGAMLACCRSAGNRLAQEDKTGG